MQSWINPEAGLQQTRGDGFADVKNRPGKELSSLISVGEEGLTIIPLPSELQFLKFLLCDGLLCDVTGFSWFYLE